MVPLSLQQHLQYLLLQPSSCILLSQEQEKVGVPAPLLSLLSPLLASLLAQIQDPTPCLSLPFSTKALRRLLDLLASGDQLAEEQEELEELVDVLGITHKLENKMKISRSQGHNGALEAKPHKFEKQFEVESAAIKELKAKDKSKVIEIDMPRSQGKRQQTEKLCEVEPAATQSICKSNVKEETTSKHLDSNIEDWDWGLKMGTKSIESNTIKRELIPKSTSASVRKQKKNKRSLCNICAKSFSSHNLKTHMENKHPVDESKKILKNIRRSESAKVLCSVCSTIWSSNVALRRHMKHHDTESDHYQPEHTVCSICSKSIPNNLKYLKHMTRRHGNTQCINCSNCDKAFSVLHIKNHEHVCKMSEDEKTCEREKNKVQCGDCGKIVRDKLKLRQHVRFIHKKEKTFKCKHCDRTDNRKDNLKIHIKGVHNGVNVDESIQKI